MKIRILKDANAVAEEAARLTASLARKVVMDRGRFVLAISGGGSPWRMLRILAGENVPWKRFHLVQADEREAVSGDPNRNLTHLRENLFDHAPIGKDHIYAMPVESEDLEAASGQYARLLGKIAGTPPVLDLVQLGLGSDGHTASLIPGDPILQVKNCDVGITGMYKGSRWMTLTYPIINRARNILWIVTGAQKAPVLKRLMAADATIPAGLIVQNNAYLLADEDAFGDIMPERAFLARKKYDTWDCY
jgi:6-phosphogluconolactonase